MKMAQLKNLGLIAVSSIPLLIFLACNDDNTRNGGEENSSTFQIVGDIIGNLSEKAVFWGTACLLASPLIIAGLFVAKAYIPLPGNIIRKLIGPIMLGLSGTIALATALLWAKEHFVLIFSLLAIIMFIVAGYWLYYNFYKIERLTKIDLNKDGKIGK